MTKSGGTSTSSTRGSGAGPAVQHVAFVLSLVAIWACWPLVRSLIPVGDRFAMVDLARKHWALNHYHFWFALAALPAAVAVGIVQAFDRRTALPLLLGPIGWLAGGAFGYALYGEFRTDSWTLAVPMPATFGFLGGVVAARLVPGHAGSRTCAAPECARSPVGEAAGCARLSNGVTLAGVPLSAEDETMHVAVIGATGSGKSTALRALMADAIRHGDRQVVADPEGASMSAFYKEGDIILYPFDTRCARWDLLSEIE